MHTGEWALLEAYLPGKIPERIGLILRDASRNALSVRIRPEWSARDDESEIWQGLAADLERMSSEIGPFETMEWLESSASQAIRLSARHAIEFADPEIAFDVLYAEHIVKELALVQSKEAIVGLGSSAPPNVQLASSICDWLLALAATITFIAGGLTRSKSLTPLSLVTTKALETEWSDPAHSTPSGIVASSHPVTR